MHRPIAVFDSGVGGLTVLSGLAKRLPYEDLIYFADNKNAPYGTKSCDRVDKLFFDVVQKMRLCNPKSIVVACNTATSVCIQKLRESFDNILIFGIQPAIKPSQKPCLVFVTETTANSQSFCSFADDFDAFVFPLRDGAMLVENGCDDRTFSKYLKKETCGIDMGKFKSIVLGCTHYAHKKSCFEAFGLPVYDGAEGLARHVVASLCAKGLVKKTKACGSVTFCLTDNSMDNFDKYINMYKVL